MRPEQPGAEPNVRCRVWRRVGVEVERHRSTTARAPAVLNDRAMSANGRDCQHHTEGPGEGQRFANRRCVVTPDLSRRRQGQRLVPGFEPDLRRVPRRERRPPRRDDVARGGQQRPAYQQLLGPGGDRARSVRSDSLAQQPVAHIGRQWLASRRTCRDGGDRPARCRHDQRDQDGDADRGRSREGRTHPPAPALLLVPPCSTQPAPGGHSTRCVGPSA